MIKEALIFISLFVLVGTASADILPEPGEYNEVIYTQQVVFEGNYDDYVFLWIGEIPSMCSPRIAEPSSTPQDFPKMYKACGPKLYAIAENDFQQLIQDNGFTIQQNEIITKEGSDASFIISLQDSGTDYAVSSFSGRYSERYPRDKGYTILSEKEILVTETVKGVNLEAGTISSTTEEKVTKSTGNTGVDDPVVPEPETNFLLILIPVLALIAIAVILFLKKRK